MLSTFFEFFQIQNGLDLEIMRTTYVVSLIISLFVYQKTENIPAGIIVPGSVVLLAGSPTKLLFLAVTTALCLLSYKLLQIAFPKKIFPEKEKVLIMTIFSVIFALSFYLLFNISSSIDHLGVLGVIVPAIIASRFMKSHRVRTLLSLVAGVVLTGLFFIAAKLTAVHILPSGFADFYNELYDASYPFDFGSTVAIYLIFGLVTIFNLILYKKYRFKTIGVLIGAYQGLIIFSPRHVLFVVAVVFCAALVARFLKEKMFFFGFRAFVIANIVSAFFYSLFEMTLLLTTGKTFVPFLGVHIAGLATCGVLTTQFVQEKPKEILFSSVITTIAVVFFVLVLLVLSKMLGFQFSLIEQIQNY